MDIPADGPLKKTKRPEGQIKYKRSFYPTDDLTNLLRMLQTRQIELKLQIKNLQNVNDKTRASLEIYQKICEYSPVGYFMLDKRGIILQANLFSSYLLGAERPQLIGRPIHTFISPKSRAQYFGFFNRLRQGRPNNSCNVEIIDKTSFTRTVQMEGWSVFVRAGKNDEIRLIVNALDISVQKESETKLQELEDQYRNILASIRDVYFRFGRDGILISASPSIHDLIGLDPEEKITDLSINRFFRHPEDARYFFDDLLRNGRISEYETEFIRCDGTTHQILITAGVISDESGEICCEGIIRDISECRKVKLALAEANRKISILDEVICHDINNQLISLQGFLSVIRHKPLDEITDEYMGKAENALTAITRQMQFIRVYQQTGLQSAEWQNIREIIKNLPIGRIPVKIDLDPVEIFADLMFAHVFYNLFDNVEQHGKNAHEIQVRGSRTAGTYTIIVSDDGIGMPHDEREKIFERGYGRYSGLGLFLIREILGVTEITIQETSRSGEGARFEIVVPKGKFRVCKEKTPDCIVNVDTSLQ